MNNQVMDNYYESVGRFAYNQILDDLNESDLLINQTVVTVRHNDTVYEYNLGNNELLIIDNVNRISCETDVTGITSTLKQELPFEKYILFERELFNRV